MRANAVRSAVEARLDVAAEKSFDAVEPDNDDGFANDTGFPLSATEQLDFNRFVARAAHVRGLSVGLKNDLDQLDVLAGDSRYKRPVPRREELTLAPDLGGCAPRSFVSGSQNCREVNV